MLATHIPCPILVPGVLAADAKFRFRAPIGMQLVGVGAACDNGTSFILDIGTAADPDAHLDEKTVTGATSTTTLFGRGDLPGGEFPHWVAGEEILVSIDFDGGAGGNAANVSIVLWLTEG
jgi:hypothetical protein